MAQNTGKRAMDGSYKTGGPNGLYQDKTLGSGVRKHLWPAGDFNNQEGGPLSAIQHADGKMNGMSKNLSTNQAVVTTYIHIPRLVVPVNMPPLVSDHDIQLRKCLTSGDVIFHLRYNNMMLQGGHATQITRKYTPDLVYCVNLASLNYILVGIQHVLSQVLLVDSPNGLPEEREFLTGQDSIFQKYTSLKTNTSTRSKDKITRRWIHFLDIITQNDFEKLMRVSLWDSIAKKVRELGTDIDEYVKETRVPNSILHEVVSDFLWDFINTYTKTAGIFVGSDEQGGNHYGQANPCVQAPTDFVGVIQVAGKNMQVRNLWSSCDSGTSSGDMLGFKL